MAFNQEWENVAVVGKGGSSTVYKAIVKSTSTFVAVKQIEIDGLSKDQINGIKGEIETMKDLSHPNILCYLGTQQSPSRVFIFLEYADRGSLRQFYANRGPLSESQISFCLQGIVAGLNYLHENGIAHRDIKCANCLLCSEGVVKLADFGASKRFESDSIVSGLKGTPHWMAPEVIKGTQMTTGWMKADVWSLGCTVVEMFTAKVPYAEYENPMTAMYKIASGEIPSLRPSALQPSPASPEMVSFIHTCCAVEPATRPSADELLAHVLLRREVGSLGDLFADLALPVIPPEDDNTLLETEIEMNNRQAPMMTQFEKENHKIARRSLDHAAGLHAPPAPQPHQLTHQQMQQRARSDSRSSVLSADDDETTIANAAETSYLEDDFCSYGLEDISRSRSRGESLGFAAGAGIGIGIGVAISEGEHEETETSSAVEGYREPRVQARLTPLSVPRASSTSRSNSRSRGQSRGMIICTSSAGISTPGGNLDASAGSDLDEVATPSVFRDNGRSASMQTHHQIPALGEQVGGMSLVEDNQTDNDSSHKYYDNVSAKNTSLPRKWSATAFPEKLLETLEQGAKHSEEHSPIEEDFDIINASHSPADADVVAEMLELPTSVTPEPGQQPADKKMYVVPLVPSFEDASEVYKSMLLKYSPRASRDLSAAEPQERVQQHEQVQGARESPAVSAEVVEGSAALKEEEDEAAPCHDDGLSEDRVTHAVEDSTEMLISPLAEKTFLVADREATSSKSADKSSSPSVRSSRLSTQNSNATQSPVNQISSSKDKLKELSPLPVVKKKAFDSLTGGAAPAPAATATAAHEAAPARLVGAPRSELNEIQSNKRSQRSKPKPSDSGPLDAERLRVVDPSRIQPAPISLRSAVLSTDPLPAKVRHEDVSRPYAPLSGDRLRLHSFADPKKQPLSLGGGVGGGGGGGIRDTAPGSSAEALERIVNQSGAAAVRKGAAQELREVRTHKAKGSLNHHAIKSTKRPRNHVSPRRIQPQPTHLSNQLGSAQGQDRVTAHMGQTGGASLMSTGGVRSQSAGVTSGYTAGRKDAQKLPPVLRGMTRNAVGSSSGSIDPIEEGRIARGVLNGGSPLRLEGPTSRYIQSAPAVSRSVNLPPINSASQVGRPSHRHGTSVDGSAALSIEDSADESAYLTSQTPKLKQPRLHNFGRPAHPSGVSAVLQQSFANVMKNYAADEQQIDSHTQGD